MAQQVEGITIEGLQPIVGLDLDTWGGKLNVIDLLIVEKLNEAIEKLNIVASDNNLITTLSSNTTLSNVYNVILATGTITLTLPSVSKTLFNTYKIKNIGTGVITIKGFGSELIDSSFNVKISNQYDSLTLVCNSTAWYII